MPATYAFIPPRIAEVGLTAPAPLPFNPFPDLPVYAISTNRDFVIDDRSVDYLTLHALAQLESEAAGLTNPTVSLPALDTNGLWVQVPNNSLATPDYFSFNVMNTVQGQGYDILTKSELLAPTWATELVVTGAVGNVTPGQVAMNNRTNLFLQARTSTTHSFYLVSLPLSQDVLAGDTVTFYVETGGNSNLTFQWTFNGSAIAGATNRSYTIAKVQPTDAGDYACLISDGTNSLITAAGTLTVEDGTGDLNLMVVVSARQDYRFKSGVTYYLGSQISFYGNTTIEAGAVIKPDWSYNAGLVILGNLTCQGEPYYPAVITSVDDDSIGEGLGYSQADGPPQPYETGVPYLELAGCKSNSISNLRMAYADWGMTTPTDSRRLEVWDCQFLQCNYGIVNLLAGDSTNALHNVLFAACSAAFGAATNAITIEAEQVTADVDDFCLGAIPPSRMALTNCIIWGNAPSAASLTSVQVALNPDATNFVSSGAGSYYLAANSPLHQSGAAGISPRLQTELKSKTTFAPVALAPFTQISGEITLAPQAHRYTNGAPDIGYFYAALDYTVADLQLTGGTLNVLPGTAVGFRIDYVPAYKQWTMIGMDVRENSSILAQGLPNQPCVFVDVQQVQEQFAWPVASGFVPDYFPALESDQPPVLNFRFAHFYAGYVSYNALPQYHFWSGLSLYGYEWSPDSAMNFTLQDCQVRGGQIDFGNPDNPDDGYGYLDYDTVLGNGAVTWNNNLFAGVSINLNPTYYWYNQVVNCDLQVTANNNLFRNSAWLIISGVPATAGNWAFRDNLFDRVQFYQDPTQPLDFDHNGNWPLVGAEIVFGAYGYTNQLQATATSDGTTEVFLHSAPPYQRGPYGNFYLPNTTPLYRAGSQTAADAGLTQYTTCTNQTKDAANQPVNIGLHYVAANYQPSTNNYQLPRPLDSDGDGVPDYVEAEHGTDINNAMTDGVTNDAYNVVYDDVDLSGNGLVGRIKKALGLQPLDPNNPLTVKQVITGEEPDIATFEVPVNYDALTNVGSLSLILNGIDVTLEDFSRATNGNTLLNWNTTYEPPGQHYIQAQFNSSRLGDDAAIPTGFGVFTAFNSSNVLQFFESGSMFDDSGAYLDAQLPCPDAIYTIQLFDPATTPPTLIRTITNAISNGMIQEDWDLTYEDGVTVFTGDTVKAVFNVTLLDPAQGTHTKMLHKLSSNEQGNNFDSIYMYTPTNGAMSYEFGNQNGVVREGLQNVADILCTPVTVGLGGHDDHYDSYFDRYTSRDFPGQPGLPGYVTSRAQIVNSLFPDMTNGITKNFFCYSHGSGTGLASYAPSGSMPDAYMDASEVANILGNHYAPKGGLGAVNK
jgi:hypothetical protein